MKNSFGNRSSVSLGTYNLFKTALSIMDEGIHIVDHEGRTVFYNTTMANLERLDPSEIIGLPLRQVFPKLTTETSTLLKVLNSGEPIYDHVQTYYTCSGASITTINSTLPIMAEGRCIGAVEIAKDLARVEQLTLAIPRLSRHSDVFPFEKAKQNNGTMYSFEHMLGKSRLFKQAKRLASIAAGNDHPVLIYGETGVGKEVFAQSIHNAGRRMSKHFVAVNCAALPESLLESTLFGTVRGAFTGALDRPGLFEEAHGGTLFLDELNSMSLLLQAKLLRALEENAVRRVGSTKLIPVDVRVMASTGIEPLEAVEQKQLREDLYFRVAVSIIEVPPLRRRAKDAILMAQEFSKKYSAAVGKPAPVFGKDVLRLFQNYRWPGNVRELKNLVTALANIDESPISVKDLPEHFKRSVSRFCAGEDNDKSSLKKVVDSTEVNMIVNSLEDTGGNVAAAARLLGISRQSLQYKIRKYGIEESF
jgi:arginine utilization regulatory protein